MYFHTTTQTVSSLTLLVVCGLAFWRGGAPERIVASICFLDWTLTPILQHVSDRAHFEVSVFAVDSLVLGALLSIALTKDRFWPLWATAFQLLELLIHVAMLIDHRVSARAYFIGTELASYLILVALALGTLVEATGARRSPHLSGRTGETPDQ
jgi:hypothetical protein